MTTMRNSAILDPVKLTDLSDEALLAAWREGSERALDTLVARHMRAAWEVAFRVMGDSAAANDVVQDAFLSAIKALPAFRGESSFRTWLFRITINEARTAVRRLGRRREDSLDDFEFATSDLGPERDTVARNEAERVAQALARLPEKQRLTVSLRLHQGLGFREIAEMVDSTEGAARVNFHHGIRKLREWLGE